MIPENNVLDTTREVTAGIQQRVQDNDSEKAIDKQV